LLYQLLTGADPSQALFQFAPLHLHALPFPAGLETLLMQMLEKDASKRPASMDAVKQELQRIAARVPAKQGSSQPGPLFQKTFIQRLTRPSKVKFMALAGLALLVVSGFGLFSLVQANQVAINNANAITTANAHASATTVAFNAANTAVVSTAVANALTPTVNATAIVTGLQNKYNNATRTNPALDDPLRDSLSGYNWDEGSNGFGGTCTFSGGAYHVSQANTNYFQYCLANTPTFSNFVFEVQMKIIKGDAGGVIFRANTHSNDFYVFLVSQDGTYQLFLCTTTNCTNSLLYSSSPAIKLGLNQTNLIAVLAQKSTIGLYVNHQLIGSVDDNTYSSGQIGVIALPWGSNGHPTEVMYSNAKVWTL
jgi:hypothetical protein